MANSGYFIGGAVLGVVAGAIGGAIWAKKRLEKGHKAQVEAMAAEFAKLDPYGPGNYGKVMAKPVSETVVNSADKEYRMAMHTGVNKALTVEDVVADLKVPSSSEVKEYRSEEHTKTDYTAAYDGTSLEEKQETIFDLMKNAEEVDLDEEEEDDDEDNTTVDIHSRLDLHSDPVVITADEAGDIPDNYESEILYYYVQNDALVDDFDEELEAPEKVVGNLLETSGFKKNMERHLYIKNPRLSVIYHIEKVFKLWEGKN